MEKIELLSKIVILLLMLVLAGFSDSQNKIVIIPALIIAFVLIFIDFKIGKKNKK